MYLIYSSNACTILYFLHIFSLGLVSGMPFLPKLKNFSECKGSKATNFRQLELKGVILLPRNLDREIHENKRDGKMAIKTSFFVRSQHCIRQTG